MAGITPDYVRDIVERLIPEAQSQLANAVLALEHFCESNEAGDNGDLVGPYSKVADLMVSRKAKPPRFRQCARP